MISCFLPLLDIGDSHHANIHDDVSHEVDAQPVKACKVPKSMTEIDYATLSGPCVLVLLFSVLVDQAECAYDEVIHAVYYLDGLFSDLVTGSCNGEVYCWPSRIHRVERDGTRLYQ